MRTRLPSKQTTRARIRDLLCGQVTRTADLAARIAAMVTADALTTIDATTFGLFNDRAGTDVGSITATLKVLTSPDNPWTAADVGKTIDVAGAGAAGGTLRTVIAAYTSAGSITLRDAAVTTVAATVTSAGGLAVWGYPPSMTLQSATLMTIAGAARHSLLPDAPGGAGREVVDRFDRVNVRDFMASGLGVADDTEKIQAAIDYGFSVGKAVWIPAGIYRISRIIVPGGDIYGEGDATELRCFADGNGFCAIALPDTARRVTLRDFKLTGNVAEELAGPKPLRGIVVGSNATGTAHSASVYDGYHRIIGVHIAGQDPGVTGFNVGIQQNLSRYTTIAHNVIESIYGINSGYGHAIVLNGFGHDVHDNHLMATIAGQGRHGVYLTDTPEASRVHHNHITGFTAAGITSNTVAPARDLVIDHNILEGCLASNPGTTGAVIELNGSSHCKIVGNVCRGSFKHGIGVYLSPFTRVSGNTVLNCQENGIWVASDDCVVTENTIEACSLSSAGTFAGILLYTCNRCVVCHNNIEATDTVAGINFNLTAPICTACCVRENIITGNTTQVKNLPGYVDGTAVPDVTGLHYLDVANTNPTAITGLSPGYEGQVVVLRFADANTSVDGTGNLFLTAAFASASKATIVFVAHSTYWYELSRSANL